MSKIEELGIKKIEFMLPVDVAEGYEYVVKEGDSVNAGDVLAKQAEAEEKQVDLVKGLGCKDAAEAEKFLKKRVGETVKYGDILAEKSGWMGKKQLLVKDGGLVSRIEDGVVVIKLGLSQPDITAPIKGDVKSIEEKVVSLESSVWKVASEKAWGKTCWGELVYLAKDADVTGQLSASLVRGKVVFWPGVLSKAIWYKLSALGVLGVVCMELPSNFDLWSSREDIFPGLIGFEWNEEEMRTFEEWLQKKAGKMCFLLPEQKMMLVE